APEGTRSRRGGLQRFKLGAFHLATTTGVPIVPMIMRGVDRVLPMGSFIVRSGRIRVDYLPPIDPTGWELEEVREHADEIREQFLQYLPPAPEPEPKQAKTG
ncbi:MAG: putative phosphoserine phosphatase/1-acylglycerol-3-phosphate O-acyltransferase, partial [Planctomycetota bacterium]